MSKQRATPCTCGDPVEGEGVRQWRRRVRPSCRATEHRGVPKSLLSPPVRHDNTIDMDAINAAAWARGLML